MSFGNKLKDFRKRSGLSQEELAKKLNISRQAITKWESDRGMPNIESLQSIALLFNVSVDSLLDQETELSNIVLKETIDLSQYQKSGKCRSQFDAVVKHKYPQANKITPLIRCTSLSKKEKILDFVIHPGIFQLIDSLRDYSAYYLIELDQHQLLVRVTRNYIVSKILNNSFNENRKVIGEDIFKKATYTL